MICTTKHKFSDMWSVFVVAQRFSCACTLLSILYLQFKQHIPTLKCCGSQRILYHEQPDESSYRTITEDFSFTDANVSELKYCTRCEHGIFHKHILI